MGIGAERSQKEAEPTLSLKSRLWESQHTLGTLGQGSTH